MTTYHVAGWNEHYENNRSRKVKDLAWVPIPNKHDGERYSRLMIRPDAAQVFSAWILILQVASRCHPRGSLVRSDGRPHDSESLSIKTRAPKSWFDVALPILTQSKWLTSEVNEQPELALDCHCDATIVSPRCQGADEERREGNRTEESEAARRELNFIPTSLRTSAFFAAWKRWPKYLEERNGGIPVTPSTIDEHLRVCIKLGPADAVIAIENGIAKNLRVPAMPFTGPPGSTPPPAPRPDIYTEPAGWREKAKRLWPDFDVTPAWNDLSSTVRNALISP